MDSSRLTGRFADWRPLGEGAGGRLFRVRDLWSGREVALKAAAESRHAEALVHEFRLLSRLRHPCLIESLDLVRDGSETAHLLEYVPAADPRSLWSEGGERAVWAALLQALRGLTFLHRHGYVHGDVAPGNILVWNDGGTWRAKVADLGLARTAREAAEGGVRGTPGFLAPECARGDPCGPAADLYSLAATALVWIDGRGAWEGLSGPERLKRVSAAPDVPAPRRRVSPELEALLRTLGRGDPAQRSPGRWGEHRTRGDAWGPESLSAAVAGVDERLGTWTTWVDSLPAGQVGSILVRGRTGSGRKTLARTMARSLVAAGWTALWDLPLEAVHDWLDAAEGDPDPVRLARELDRRFAGRDIVLLWPNRRRDLESRLLRAFAARRADERSRVRTVVLKWMSAVEDDPDDDWLRGASRHLEETWTGPDEEAMEGIAGDLFPPEEGFAPEGRPRLPAGSLPLSAVLLKRAGNPEAAVPGAGDGKEGVRNEVLRIWEGASPPTRDAFLVLAWSDGPWEPGEIAKVAGWDDAETCEAASGIAAARLTQRTYEGDRALERLGDWLAREVLAKAGEGHFSPDRLAAMGHRLDSIPDLPADLGLAGALWKAGGRPARYLIRSLERSLTEGRYEAVLEAGRWMADSPPEVAQQAAIWDRVLRAARRLGKYPEQVQALARLIALESTSDAIPHRQELSQALASLGRWRECLEQCDLIEASGPDGTVRLWARLQRAETLWQEGRFAEADAEYAQVEPDLRPDMKDEWLRYGVGRARQYGQRGGIKEASLHLARVRDRVGEEKCMNDSMYLITSGAVAIRQGESQRALGLLQKATELTSASGAWAEYLRATTRVSNVAYGLGDVLRAARTAAESFSVATALGNDRLTAIVDSYLGHYEVDTGNLGSAFRRGTRLTEVAKLLGDENQELQGWRLIARVACLSGWENLVVEAVKELRIRGKKLGTVEPQGHACYCEGAFHMGNQNWSSAAKSFRNAEMVYGSAGLATEELEVRFYGLICQFRMAGNRSAAAELSQLNFDIFPLLLPISHLARMEIMGTLSSASSEGATAILQQLWDQGRVMELIEWGPRLLADGDTIPRLEIKKSLIGAIQRAANSLDDSDLRTQFLSFPKIRLALHSVAG